MSTRSTISILELNGTVKQIYCHYDGYVSNNGRLLKTFYNTPNLVKELISGGDLSVLGEYINPVGLHSFNIPEPNCCVYYGRDRGESNTEFRVFRDWDYFKFSRQKEQYDYLYIESENRWYLLGDKTEKLTFLCQLDSEQLPELTLDDIEDLLGYKFKLVS